QCHSLCTISVSTSSWPGRRVRVLGEVFRRVYWKSGLLRSYITVLLQLKPACWLIILPVEWHMKFASRWGVSVRVCVCVCVCVCVWSHRSITAPLLVACLTHSVCVGGSFFNAKLD